MVVHWEGVLMFILGLVDEFRMLVLLEMKRLWRRRVRKRRTRKSKYRSNNRKRRMWVREVKRIRLLPLVSE